MAGVTRSADKEDAGGDDSDDEEISTDAGTSSKKKKPKPSSSASSSSISILTRTTSEFETCTQEKAVEFDPVQGNDYFPFFLLT